MDHIFPSKYLNDLKELVNDPDIKRLTMYKNNGSKKHKNRGKTERNREI